MRVLQAIFLSIAIHFLMVLLVQYAPVAKQQSAPVTIEIVENQPLREQRQLVREHLVPESQKVTESEDPTRFLSAQTQRVKKQTRADQSGMTKNRGDKTPNEQARAQNQEPKKPNPIDAFGTEYRKNILSQNRGSEAGVSTVGESIQDVAVGSFTALNTDRHLYYSFYSRIEELIRYRWESAILRTIEQTPPSSFNSVNDTWITSLEIWLKANGEYHSAHLMKESGIRGFDQAAIQAFMQARLFPNPPKDIVESDGLIRLKYAFRVYHRPTLMGRSRN